LPDRQYRTIPRCVGDYESVFNSGVTPNVAPRGSRLPLLVTLLELSACVQDDAPIEGHDSHWVTTPQTWLGLFPHEYRQPWKPELPGDVVNDIDLAGIETGF
jgi:hypothetical protein